VARPTQQDIGRRISLRYVLPGLGQSEAVGTLESWADGELVVRRRDGSELRISEQRVVAARLVPDPPPRRTRPDRPA
jgi:hypothetical protein